MSKQSVRGSQELVRGGMSQMSMGELKVGDSERYAAMIEQLRKLIDHEKKTTFM